MALVFVYLVELPRVNLLIKVLVLVFFPMYVSKYSSWCSWKADESLNILSSKYLTVLWALLDFLLFINSIIETYSSILVQEIGHIWAFEERGSWSTKVGHDYVRIYQHKYRHTFFWGIRVWGYWCTSFQTIHTWVNHYTRRISTLFCTVR